jgi:ankyrin repeat protein
MRVHDGEARAVLLSRVVSWWAAQLEETPLLVACRQGHHSVLSVLLRFKADPNVVDKVHSRRRVV